MSHTSGENVYSMPAKGISAVITMRSRIRARASARVITIPAQTEQHTKLVTFPAPGQRANGRSALRSGQNALSEGVRMTLVALFALLGWPHPTRDNDPGPSAARPCHWEVTSLVSKLRLPSAGNKAAAAAVQKFPAEELADEAMLRAA